MIGIGILVAIFVRFLDGQFIIYYFRFVVDTAWFSANTRLITLTALRHYFHRNLRIALCRVAFICIMGCLLISATCLAGNFTWNSTYY